MEEWGVNISGKVVGSLKVTGLIRLISDFRNSTAHIQYDKKTNVLMLQVFTPQVHLLWSVHRSSSMSQWCGRGQPLWRGWHCVHPPVAASPTALQMQLPCNGVHFPLTERKRKPQCKCWIIDTMRKVGCSDYTPKVVMCTCARCRSYCCILTRWFLIRSSTASTLYLYSSRHSIRHLETESRHPIYGATLCQDTGGSFTFKLSNCFTVCES